MTRHRAIVDDAGALAAAPFIVVTFCTPSYANLAGRLLNSGRSFHLPMVLIETDAVHRSISVNGSEDLTKTKAAFILQALEAYGKPILFLDADLVFRGPPQRIEALVGACDFAIYNWLVDPYTDCWGPSQFNSDPTPQDRYWNYFHAIDHFDPSQLLCSGPTQFWAPTPAARALLADWQTAIRDYPGAADDECLNFVFNNRDNSHLRAHWLDKAYVRFPWWPHVAPVIEHPETVARDREKNHGLGDGPQKIFYPERAVLQPPPPGVTPRWALIDTHGNRLLRLDAGRLIDAGPFRGDFWP